MGYDTTDYGDLEPLGNYIEEQDVLNQTNFDADLPADFLTFNEPPPEQNLPPLPPLPIEPLIDSFIEDPLDSFGPSLIDSSATQPPTIQETAALPDYIDPRFLNDTNVYAGNGFQEQQQQQQQQLNYNINYPVANPSYPSNVHHYGSSYAPLANNYAQSSAQYYPPQPANNEFVVPPQPINEIPVSAAPSGMPANVPANGESIEDAQRLSNSSSGYTYSSYHKKAASKRHRVPSPILEGNEPPLKRAEKGPNGELLRSGRIPRVTRKDQARPDPREWYGPPPPRPESWGPKDKSQRPLFKYTEYGELERGKTYTVTEMRWYLYGPKVSEKHIFKLPQRLPGVRQVKGKVRQGLTLWIGWVAPQSNDRYPQGQQSQRCRFADCADPNRTIRSGFPRIIFDERMNTEGEALDPYHNAGYAHLFCFERHFDLVDAFLRLDVRPDERDFKREENLGKISRIYQDIRCEVDAWWETELPKYRKAREMGGKRNRAYENSLSYRLVNHALEHTSETRQRVRETRAGADISKHKGDLLRQKFLRDCLTWQLTDEAGDPVPGAEQQLQQLMSRKRRRESKPNQPAKRQKQNEDAGQDYPSTPGSGYGIYDYQTQYPPSPTAYPSTPSALPYSPSYGMMHSPQMYQELITPYYQQQVGTPSTMNSPKSMNSPITPIQNPATMVTPNSPHTPSHALQAVEEFNKAGPSQEQQQDSPAVIPIDPRLLLIDNITTPKVQAQQAHDTSLPAKIIDEPPSESLSSSSDKVDQNNVEKNNVDENRVDEGTGPEFILDESFSEFMEAKTQDLEDLFGDAVVDFDETAAAEEPIAEEDDASRVSPIDTA
ncbi:uncharacterized protein GGS25DRAFT_145269 [Hypoxylon fragiforme]|uniref:uncharacterized protein n=1 Tax=Hypoxylon fragiforme TaxID=63214 RepID=UPI0020C5DBFD|nr:uncharacterized protein GGS25DRAFT_145269 [Hypoxylon fragiforme]KAI2612998.1 hypothetical protein GGS25DRAFT_145269 [Hypoxylon fragiforme]